MGDQPAAARWMLPVVLATHLALAACYALLLPLWGAVPDEPLHYSHVKYVAEKWRLPVIQDPFRRDLKEYYFVADPAGAAQHGPAFYWPEAVIYKLTEGLTIYPQVLENVHVTDKKAAQDDADVQAAVKAVAEALGDTGRILVRESGTEPLVRVMVEAPEHETCQKYVQQVVDVIKAKGYAI